MLFAFATFSAFFCCKYVNLWLSQCDLLFVTFFPFFLCKHVNLWLSQCDLLLSHFLQFFLQTFYQLSDFFYCHNVMVFILWLIYQFSAHHGQPSHNSNYDEDHQLFNEKVKWNPPMFWRTLNNQFTLSLVWMYFSPYHWRFLRHHWGRTPSAGPHLVDFLCHVIIIAAVAVALVMLYIAMFGLSENNKPENEDEDEL